MSPLQKLAPPYNQNFSLFSASFFLFFLASKCVGLSLGYALDDYATLGASKGHVEGFLLSQGRFTFAFLQLGLNVSDLKQPELTGIGFFLSGGALLLICWLTLTDWLQRNLALAIAMGAFLGSHPFFAEYVSFRQSLFPMGICFALIACATILISKNSENSIARVCMAAGLAAIASGINQIAMAFFCTAALGISLQKRGALPRHQAVFLAVRNSVLMGALASTFYLIIFSLSMHLIPIAADARMSTIGSKQIGHRISDILMLLHGIWAGAHPLIGPLAAICTLFSIVAVGFRLSTKIEQWSNLLAGALLIIVGTTFSLLPVALSGVWWPVPRTLIAFPLAIALGIAVLSSGAPRIQITMASCALLLSSVVFSGKSGSLLIDQQRLNRWDMGLAREIVMKIGESAKIDSSTPIFIHRAKWAYEVDQNMPIGDANMSAMSVNWAVDALFEEASGRRLDVRLGVQGDSICADAPSFPTSGSIIRTTTTINVCL